MLVADFAFREGGRPPTKHPRKRLVRKLADLVVAGQDAGNRRRGEFAQKFVVVHAKDGDLLGDGYSGSLAGLDDFQRRRIAGGHDRDGLGKGNQPCLEGRPGVVRDENRRGCAMPGDFVRKRLRTEPRPAVLDFGRHEAERAEASEPKKIVCAESGDCDVVVLNEGDIFGGVGGLGAEDNDGCGLRNRSLGQRVERILVRHDAVVSAEPDRLENVRFGYSLRNAQMKLPVPPRTGLFGETAEELPPGRDR